MPDQASDGRSHLSYQGLGQSAQENRQDAASAGDPPDVGHGVLSAGSQSSGLEIDQSRDQGRSGSRSQGRRHRDPHYLNWREDQLRKLDAEYEDFHRERQDRFNAEFESWRASRRPQQDAG